MKWIIDLLNFEIFKKFRNKDEWEPEPLYIEAPDLDDPIEEDKEDKDKSIIIIDI